MTRETAIEILKELWRTKYPLYLESDIRKALEMAIQSLEQEPRKDEVILTNKEYRELVSSEYENGYAKGFRDAIEQEPSGDLIQRQDDRGVSLKSVKHILYDVCLHEDNMALFSKLLDRVNKLRDWEEYLTIKQEPSGDAISRQAVLDLCDKRTKYDIPYEYYEGKKHIRGWDIGRIINMTKLMQLPSVNPQENTGHWIENAPEYQNIDPPYICSECGNMHLRKTNYCDQCGTKMVEP